VSRHDAIFLEQQFIDGLIGERGARLGNDGCRRRSGCRRHLRDDEMNAMAQMLALLALRRRRNAAARQAEKPPYLSRLKSDISVPAA